MKGERTGMAIERRTEKGEAATIGWVIFTCGKAYGLNVGHLAGYSILQIKANTAEFNVWSHMSTTITRRHSSTKVIIIKNLLICCLHSLDLILNNKGRTSAPAFDLGLPSLELQGM